MSRLIQNDHLWTEEEVAYKKSRCAEDEIARNRALYGPGGELEGHGEGEVQVGDPGGGTHSLLNLAKDIFEHVSGLTFEEAQAELKSHNLPAEGNEQEVKTALAEYLQTQRKNGANR